MTPLTLCFDTNPFADDDRTPLPDAASRLMKPKINRVGDPNESSGYDRCATPPYALEPLLPFIPRDSVIWEPAAGEGLMVRALHEAGYSNVIATDILTGQNFYDYQPPHWDVLITNPPYSTKVPFFEHAYTLGKPFALLMPVELMGTSSGQRPMDEHGFQLMLLDGRVNFKMPIAGWGGEKGPDGKRKGSGAQFPTCWYTWGLNLPQQVMIGKMPGRTRVQEDTGGVVMKRWRTAVSEIASAALAAGRSQREIIEAISTLAVGDYTGLEMVAARLCKRGSRR